MWDVHHTRLWKKHVDGAGLLAPREGSSRAIFSPSPVCTRAGDPFLVHKLTCVVPSPHLAGRRVESDQENFHLSEGAASV